MVFKKNKRMIDIKGIDKTELKNLKYIDLFCGIGGFHQALSSFEACCVFSSEIDECAKAVYKANYRKEVAGDITRIKESDIPSHDILCAGFPCQAFSISGNQKGFDDERGSLFFEIIRIATVHKPKIILLENVSNLAKHDNKKTLKTIIDMLETIGYNVYYEILNASDYSIPQQRKRIYFVCFRKDLEILNFNFPPKEKSQICLKDIILPDSETQQYVINRKDIVFNNAEISADIFGDFPQEPIRIGTVNKGGQGERIYHEKGHAITLSAYGGGVGAKTGLYLINGKVRRLAPCECARLQGFPDTFIIDKNQNQAYKQFGNSLVVDVVQKILQCVNEVLR